MLTADTSLMRSKEPTLEERSCPVDTGEHRHRRFTTAKENSAVVLISKIREFTVSLKPVGDDDCAGFHGILHKRQQALRRGVRYTSHSDPADRTTSNLNCNSHKRLVSDVSAAPACLETTDESLVHLDRPGQAVPAWPDHSTPDLVEPSPGRTVATQSKNPLKPKCACTVLLADHPPDGPEPDRQRTTGVLEEGTRRDRHLLPAGRAHPQTTRRPPTSGRLAGRTSLPFWPSESRKIFATGLVGTEAGLKFPQGSRVIIH